VEEKERWFSCVFCTILVAMGLLAWLFVLDGTGISAPCGQVNSVCVAIDTFGFWLRRNVTVVMSETTRYTPNE